MLNKEAEVKGFLREIDRMRILHGGKSKETPFLMK